MSDETTEMGQLQQALDLYAATHGVTAANMLMLSILAKTRDPLLLRALRGLRRLSGGPAGIGRGTSYEIADALDRFLRRSRIATPSYHWASGDGDSD